MRPADQQLRGHDRADPRLGEYGWPGGVLFDEVAQLGIAFGELPVTDDATIFVIAKGM